VGSITAGSAIIPVSKVPQNQWVSVKSTNLFFCDDSRNDLPEFSSGVRLQDQALQANISTAHFHRRMHRDAMLAEGWWCSHLCRCAHRLIGQCTLHAASIPPVFRATCFPYAYAVCTPVISLLRRFGKGQVCVGAMILLTLATVRQRCLSG
jgi:hypothetical protein